MPKAVQELIMRYRSYLQELQDIRVVGLVLFVIVVLLVSWSGIKAIDTNYQLQKQITSLRQQNSLQQLRNQNLRLQNDYYQTKQYLDITARQNFGLAAPGEKELIVPKAVALQHTVAPPSGQKDTAVGNAQPFWQRNFYAWVDFFLHRTTED